VKKNSFGLLELEMADLERFWRKTPLEPLGVNFHNFWSEKLHCGKKQRKKLGCLNVTISWIPWNEGLELFELDVEQDNFKLLWLLLCVNILFYFEKKKNLFLCQKLHNFVKKSTWNFRG
jgi:hypothetical protein